MEHLIICTLASALTAILGFYIGHRGYEGVKKDLHNKELEFESLKARFRGKAK